MIARRIASSTLALAAVIALFGCAGKRDHALRTTPGPALAGLYKGRLEDSAGESHRFRVLLFAEAPDRFHAELLAPLGSTQMILDGGDGRLAVTLVRDGVSYVGPARPAALERILGIAVSLEDLVGGLLDGRVEDPTFTVERSDGPTGELPESLELRTPSATLSLVLRRRQPMPPGGSLLGRGEPAQGTEVRPLEELTVEDARLPGGEGRL